MSSRDGLRPTWALKAYLLGLLSFGVDEDTIQETHFVYVVDAHVLSSDFVVFSAYRNRQVRGSFLLVKRILGAG